MKPILFPWKTRFYPVSSIFLFSSYLSGTKVGWKEDPVFHSEIGAQNFQASKSSNHQNTVQEYLALGKWGGEG